jgi:DNA-binding FadR family transcriptional regulator
MHSESADSGEVAISLPRLRGVRASDALADRLRRLIVEGGLDETERLPSQRELMDQTGLSRSTVREALKMLEAENLVRTRPGRGGTYVRRLDTGDIAATLRVFVEGHRIDFETLLDTRQAVEPHCAALAARNATVADLTELDRLHRDMVEHRDTPEAFLHANLAWHLAVVNASHNDLLIAFLHAISSSVHAGMQIDDQDTATGVRNEAVTAHEKLQEHLHLRDPAGAERSMARHLHEYQAQARSWHHPADVPLEP